MSITFNSKGPASVFFGSKAVAAIYRGATLVWQKITKLFKDSYYNTEAKLIEFVPSTDITLSSVSTLGEWYNTNGRLRILNEVGLCVAYSASNGAEGDVTIYNKTGVLKTWSSLGSITLYAGNKYYISMRGENDGMYIPQYVGLTGNYKTFSNIQNINSVYSGAADHRCSGDATTFAEIQQKPVGTYFVWKGTAFTNSMKPNESGVGNPYPYLLKRDMSRVKKVFIDDDFNNVPGPYNDDMARYAYIYYVMGTTEGDEFAMNTSHWNQGFSVGGGTIFNNNQNKIYTLTGSMGVNRINSMTPVTEEPANKELFAIYYKDAVAWSSGPTGRAVVAWNGSAWEYATSWTSEWTADDNYDLTNYVEKANDSYAKDFNLVSVQTGDKYFARVNGSDI